MVTWTRTLGLAAAVAGVAAGRVEEAAAQGLPSVREVVDHLDDLYRSKSSHTIMTMTVVRRRGTRTLTLEGWSRGTDQALVVIRAPAREAGTATLRTDDGLWNYAPRADRLIRIPPGLLAESWMGSHFTNDDLLRETSYLSDHTGTAQWITEDGRRLLQVTLIPDPGTPVVYTRLVFLVDADGWTPRRAEYYDQETLTRSMTFDRVETISGKRIPLRLVVQPAAHPEEHTEVVYDRLQLDVPVAADLFTRRGLRRVAVE